jgi:hypothetical protein
VQPHGSTHDPGGSEGSSSVRQMKHRRGASTGFSGVAAATAGVSWVSDDMVEDAPRVACRAGESEIMKRYSIEVCSSFYRIMRFEMFGVEY